jgi:hypothetical protein
MKATEAIPFFNSVVGKEFVRPEALAEESLRRIVASYSFTDT